MDRITHDIGAGRRTELLAEATAARRGAGFEIGKQNPASPIRGIIVAALLVVSLALGAQPAVAAGGVQGGGSATRHLLR